MKYTLNQKKVEYIPEGQANPGDETILVHQATDISKGLPWSGEGFTVEPLFKNDLFPTFISETKALLISLWQSAGLPVSNDFDPGKYHTIAKTQSLHLDAVEKTKVISTEVFSLSIQQVETRISTICKTELVARNPWDGASVFHFRVVRPNSSDNNPLHRDVWLEDYANCINLYIPVVGSNKDSSLAIIPGSHLWPENSVVRTDDGAIINGTRFNVPAVMEIKKDHQVVRPDPKENEMLIFSPYLIHGGAANLNTDLTRISIELRLWKKNQP
jgi:hypothetical protein